MPYPTARCANVARSGSLLGGLFLEANALPFVELLEVARFDGVAVEEPLLTALVLDEPETAIPDQTLDCSARHVVTSAGQAEWP